MTALYDLPLRDMTKKKEAKMEVFWVCYVEGTNGGRHYRHRDFDLAWKEAERLARLPDVQGKQVYLLECIGTCKLDPLPIKWEIPE